MKRIPDSGRPISDFYKNPSHYFEIFQMYLDKAQPVRLAKHSKGKFWRIEAVGMGLDGEIQRIVISSTNGFYREWKNDRRSLPMPQGKIYFTLQRMGYDVGGHYGGIASRYESYAVQGISNLGTNDHHDALIEKELRKLQRRQESVEEL